MTLTYCLQNVNLMDAYTSAAVYSKVQYLLPLLRSKRCKVFIWTDCTMGSIKNGKIISLIISDKSYYTLYHW